MKKLLILAVLGLALLQPGCTLTDSFDERMQRVDNIHYLQSRMLVDEWDYFWLYERASRLTPWRITVGY
ncbi:MAG: hypothetical protein ACOC93_03855 [Planctomycetota bacterium]